MDFDACVDETAAGTRFRELGLAALALEDASFIAGHFNFTTPIDLTLHDTKYAFPTRAATEEASTMEHEAQVLGPLVANAKPSKFGRNTETVYDATVRKAAEYVADEYTVAGLDLDRMMSHVHLALFPLAKAIHAEPYKLNVMTTDGHFKAHADTPREHPTHGLSIGTLVVCLPSFFTGGVLRLGHGRENSVKLDWGSNTRSKYSHRGPAKSLVQYAAFYGDIEHEITKVESGHRLTLTYVLYHDQTTALSTASNGTQKGDTAAPQASDAPAGADVTDVDTTVPPMVSPSLTGTPMETQLVKASRFRALLVDCLKSPDFLPRGGALGFACLHLYEQAQLPPNSLLQPHVSQKDLLLKGMDSLVCIAASSLGLRVHVVPALTEDCAGGRLLVGRMPLKSESRFLRREATAESLTDALGKGPVDSKHVKWCVQLPGAPGFCPPPPLDPTRAAPMASYSTMWYSDTGYFGNEASESTFYTHVVLVVLVPSIDKRVPGSVVPPVPEPAPTTDRWSSWSRPEVKERSWNFVPKLPENWDTAATALTAELLEPTENARGLELMALTVPQLKRKCKDLGLAIAGTKADLVDRLVAAEPPPPARPAKKQRRRT